MKHFLPRKRLKWREPVAVYRARIEQEDKAVSPWLKPGFVLLIASSLMLQWWSAKLNPHRNPPSLALALIISVPAGILFVYILPVLYQYIPSEVTLFDNAILLNNGGSPIRWKIRDIDNCTLSSIQTTEGTQPVFVIQTRRKKTFIGVPVELTAQVIKTLDEIGVKVVTTAQPVSPHNGVTAVCG